MNAIRLASLLILLATTPGGARAQAGGPLPYQDPHLSTAQRVDDLVSRMTLEEKTSQMINTLRGDPAAGRARLRLVERRTARSGALGISHVVSAGHRHGGDVGRGLVGREST